VAEKNKVIVSGSFDNLVSRHVRFLEEASKAGDLYVLLWSDEEARRLDGELPRFPEEERLYLIQAIRYVSDVRLVAAQAERDALPQTGQIEAAIWAVDESCDTPSKRAFCSSHAMECRVFADDELRGFDGAGIQNVGVDSETARNAAPTARKRVLVTGCFDWLHSGHVRLFEEVSQLGDLHVVVGHDANVRLLKGAPHPLFCQDERRYMVQAIRYVKQALISSGHGWLDAEPEIVAINPDMYVVNEDGDVPEKREFCQGHGIEYVVLSRKPKPGLPGRRSTLLRGF
jgi:cytidyltransferase-like protein